MTSVGPDSEEQNRAMRVLSDGLVALPYNSASKVLLSNNKGAFALPYDAGTHLARIIWRCTDEEGRVRCRWEPTKDTAAISKSWGDKVATSFFPCFRAGPIFFAINEFLIFILLEYYSSGWVTPGRGKFSICPQNQIQLCTFFTLLACILKKRSDIYITCAFRKKKTRDSSTAGSIKIRNIWITAISFTVHKPDGLWNPPNLFEGLAEVHWIRQLTSYYTLGRNFLYYAMHKQMVYEVLPAHRYFAGKY